MSSLLLRPLSRRATQFSKNITTITSVRASKVQSLNTSLQPQKRHLQSSSKMAGIVESIRNTIGENLGGPAQALSTHQFTLDEVPDLDGKVAVVTGGSEGIGFGCTYTLLKHNVAKVFVLAPRKEVMDGAIDVFAKELGQDKADRVEFIQTDLMDWPQVAQVAEQIKKKTDRLDILINK